jgi:hypothetical protein
MASPTTDLQNFAQSVYLVIKGRYFDDITGTDGVTFQQQVADWVNQYIDELENMVDNNGELVNWRWARELAYELGTVAAGDTSITAPTGVQNLIANEKRYVQILSAADSSVLSNWTVVAPEDISDDSNKVDEDMCTFVNGNIQFSREFNDEEDGGTIIGDAIVSLPRMVVSVDGSGNLSATNVKILTTVKPKQLLILGVAKNATLPDIVQGGLSPSYVQKYNDLLQGALAKNSASARSDVMERENFSGITGVW